MTADEFDARNKTEWAGAIGEAFGTNVPASSRWEDPGAMVEVLTPFMRKNLAHVFIPRPGGSDVESVESAAEPGCLEFTASSGGMALVFKPAVLHFEHIPESPWNSFFVLDTKPLRPSGVGSVSGDCEEVAEVVPGEYAERSVYEEGHMGYEEDGEEAPLPTSARLACRFFRGKFLLVAKRSIWNMDSTTYDGRHNRMTAQQIRAAIELALTKR